MMSRLLTYFILVPLILLLSTVSIGGWFPYVITAIWVSCALVIFVAYKRVKYLSKIKKGLVVFLMAVVLLFSLGGEKSFAMSDKQFDACQEEIMKLEEIPEELRTDDQKKRLTELLEDYKKEIKKRNKGDRACPTAQQMVKNVLADCWLCDMVYVIVESTDRLASSFLNVVREKEYALILLAYGFAFWLVMRTLGFILTLGMGDVGAYITDLFKRLLMVIVVAGFLHMPVRSLVDFFVTPVFTFSAALSSSIQAANTSKEGEEFSNILARKVGATSLQCSYCQELGENAPAVPKGQSKYANYTNKVLSKRAISPAFRNSLLCITCNVYALTAPATVLGEYMECAGIEDFKPILGGLDKITGWFTGIHIGFYNLALFIPGVILYLCFFAISAIFVFPLIENFFRIGFVIVLLPFLVVAYAFPSTREYTKRGFRLLLYAMFVFLAISIFLTVLMGIFNSLFLGKAERVATMIAENRANELAKYFFFSAKPYGAIIFYGSILLVFLAWQLYKTLDEFCRTLTNINLTSSGGFEAVQSTWGGLSGMRSVIDTVYSAPWSSSSTAVDNMKRDARIRGANPYHSSEAISRAIRSKTAATARHYEARIKEKGERLGEKASRGASLLTEKADKKIYAGGRGLNNFLTRKGTELLSRSNNANASKFSKASAAFAGHILLGSRRAVYGVSMAVRFVNVLGGAVLAKVSYVGVRLLGSASAGIVKKSGMWLSRNKYFTKTSALLLHKVPQRLKARAGDLVHMTTFAMLGGISAYYKIASRLKGNKNTLNPEGPANGRSGGEQTGQGGSGDTKRTFRQRLSRLFTLPVFFGQTKKGNDDTDTTGNLRPDEKKDQTNDRRQRKPDEKGQDQNNREGRPDSSNNRNGEGTQSGGVGGRTGDHRQRNYDERGQNQNDRKGGNGQGQQKDTPRRKSNFEKTLEKINIEAWKYYSKNTYHSSDDLLHKPVGEAFSDIGKATVRTYNRAKDAYNNVKDGYRNIRNRNRNKK